MKIVYRAFDGAEFDNEPACLEYEQAMKGNNVVMMDCSENIVTNTECAAVVWLKDEDSAEVFHGMAKENGDEAAAHTIPKKEWGFFFWDEYDEKYIWVPDESLDHLNALREEVRARGEKI
jgi:hypothetical protein